VKAVGNAFWMTKLSTNDQQDLFTVRLRQWGSPISS
jgi:hypothetical protein